LGCGVFKGPLFSRTSPEYATDVFLIFRRLVGAIVTGAMLLWYDEASQGLSGHAVNPSMEALAHHSNH